MVFPGNFLRAGRLQTLTDGLRSHTHTHTHTPGDEHKQTQKRQRGDTRWEPFALSKSQQWFSPDEKMSVAVQYTQHHPRIFFPMTFYKVKCCAKVSHLRPAESDYAAERALIVLPVRGVTGWGLAPDLLGRATSPDKYHSPPVVVNHKRLSGDM